MSQRQPLPFAPAKAEPRPAAPVGGRNSDAAQCGEEVRGMTARKARWSLAALVGASGLLALAACSTNEPYGARYHEYGYSYTHRQHGLYNDVQYRYQRSRDED